MLATDFDTQKTNQKIRDLQNNIHESEFYGPHKLNLMQVLDTFKHYCENVGKYNNKDSLEYLLYSRYFEEKGKNGKLGKEINKLLNNGNQEKVRLSELKADKAKAYAPFSKVSYRLLSVTIHYGDLTGGHYYSYVRVGDRWFRFNDTVVTEVPKSKVFEDGQGLLSSFAGCYCLFYEFEQDEEGPNNEPLQMVTLG